ncbi:MAG: hypothetical protein RLZZ507_3280 [Cyanobacteriota bacterium]|jgi:hypothetical protein
MNIHTFDNNYVTCPICQRNNRTKPVKTYIGLFTCPYCQEKLVVCKSGHYVRDPFTWKQIVISSALRRQSRPLARMVRDLLLLKRPFLALAMGCAVLLTTIAITQESTSHNQQLLPGNEKLTGD